MDLIPLVELSVAEAHQILATHFQSANLPPLVSVENEDWGRDYLLTLLFDQPREALARAGLTPDDPRPNSPGQESQQTGTDPRSPS